jgi:hypothetical protein
MRKIVAIACIFVICGLILATPVQGKGSEKAHERIPAMNIVSGQAVVVPRIAVEMSPALEPADILVEVNDGAIIILLLDKSEFNADDFLSTLADASGVIVLTITKEPFLWVKMGDGIDLETAEQLILSILIEVRHDTAKNTINNVR